MQNNFDATFAKNLRFIKAGERKKYGKAKEVARFLDRYEDLVWILQQQVAYLVSLGMCVDSHEEQQTFYTVCKRLFDDLHDQRTLHLLEAMLRYLASKEIEKSKNLTDVFHPGKEHENDPMSRDKSCAMNLFSWLALSEIHFVSLVHPLTDTKADSRRGPETLFMKVERANNNNDVFALTEQDFTEAPNNDKRFEDYDKKEITSEFIQSLARLEAFMTEEFLPAVKAIRLPDTLRKFFAFSMAAVERRRFGAGNQKESKSGEPLLNLFIMGVLVPILEHPEQYAGKAAFLFDGGFEREMKKNHDAIAYNFKMLARFLRMTVGGVKGKANMEDKVVALIQKIRDELLRYVLDQVRTVSEHSSTPLVVDVCLSHFDMKRHTVMLSSAACMHLSVMLKKYTSKLSINDQDPVAKLCKTIKDWSPSEIKEAREENNFHVFQINTRFLFTEGKLVICNSSKCAVPPRMSSVTLAEGESFGELVETLQLDDTRFLVFENVFIAAKDFTSKRLRDLKVELENELSTVQGQDFGIAHKLSICLEKIQELLALRADSDELIEPMKACLDARRAYLAYLTDLETGLNQVERAQARHRRELAQVTKEMERISEFSLSLRIPKKLSEAAERSGKPLRIATAQATISRLQEFGRSTAVKNLSYSPMVTHSLKHLKNIRVVVSHNIDKSCKERDIYLNFHLSNGGVEITVLVRRNGGDRIIEQVGLVEERLRDLRKADDDATEKLGATVPFLVEFNSSQLVKLLADAAAGR